MTETIQPFPETIKVGGIRYRVRLLAETLRSDNLGEQRPMVCEILLEAGAPEQRRRWTLIHEIVEAIDFELELELRHPQISALAAAFDQVLLDNPALVALYGGTGEAD